MDISIVVPKIDGATDLLPASGTPLIELVGVAVALPYLR